MTTAIRSRWAAVGAAVAVTLGAGGIGLVSATSPAGAVAYVPIDPCRAADTRPGDDNVGPRSNPIGAGETHTVNSNDGECSGDIPGSATGLQLNVTAVGATLPSFLTIWASGAQPLASSLNPTPGEPPVPNAVTTGITAAGNFNIFNNAGAVDVVVDIVGYYADHNHDDRYYTKAQVDAAIAGAAQVRNPVASSNSTSAFSYDDGASGTWQNVISTSITIPAGFTATVEAVFGAESSCYAGALDRYCSIRIQANGVSLAPDEGFSNAFDSTDSGTADVTDYEETSVTRVTTLSAGTYTIQVQASAPASTQFRLDDKVLFVEAHLSPA